MAGQDRCTQCGGELPPDAPQGLCPQCLMKIGLPGGASASQQSPYDVTNNGSSGPVPPGGFVPPEPAELAEQFPQLEVLELLGQGGMGVVYKARQKQLDRLVALKVLPPEISRDTAFAERFTREARALAKLSHPRIVSVFDFGNTDSGLYYFVMEYVDGTDLRRVIRGEELSPHEALAIVPQICEALQYAHEEGVVHRDIKPENILLDKKGKVRIADFGLAKLLDLPATRYALTQAHHTMGTPHYMAPEQVEHPGQVDHRADIYSLGVVFYEMLTGELPLGRFPPPSERVQVDVRLDEVVLKTLEKAPERRYQHASEVKIDVETISSEEGAKQRRPSILGATKARDDPRAIRERLWIPAAGLIVAGIINCLGVAGALMAALVHLIRGGLSGSMFGFLPGAVELGVVVAAAAHGACVVLGGWNLMQLRSHRLALVGTILAMIPFFPGAIVGLPMGIWALVVMTKDEVKAAFGREDIAVEVPPKVREFAVSAVGDVKEAFIRGKAEVEKIVAENRTRSEEHEASKPKKPLQMATGSIGLGLVSMLIGSSNIGFPTKFAFVLLCAFFAILLGVYTIKAVRSFRDHLVLAGLAGTGIGMAMVSAVILLVSAARGG
ncbi:MAG: serine/threonine protein kinase [Phycisphaerales bacterium]|nr:MAG: serine/threonine protein kinase [Phycisphaerales bacterium]